MKNKTQALSSLAHLARVATALAVLASGLSACGGGGGDSGATTPASAPGNAALAFALPSPPNILAGDVYELDLRLQVSSVQGTQSYAVALSSTNPEVAEVSPRRCTLSTDSSQSSQCRITLMGKSAGLATIRAEGAGVNLVTTSTLVTSSVNFGALAIELADGVLAPAPVSLSVPAGASAPYAMQIKARIAGSSGLGAAQAAAISFAGGAGTSFSPASCAVTTAQPECVTTATMSSLASITVSASATGYTGYATATVTGVPTTGAANGQLVLSSQSGNNVPQDMKAPLFLNWTAASSPDTVKVTVKLGNGPISFYTFAPGTNVTPLLSKEQDCSLKYVGPKSADNVLSCGFGLTTSQASGTTTASITAASASGKQYTLGSLTLGAVTPEAPRRTVTFTNNSSQTVYVGITGGAAASYVSASTPSLPPSAVTANMKPGAGSFCGPSNPQAACPIGTTCLQGGASPSATNTPYFCYYDQPSLTQGHAIAANGGTTTISVSGSSLSPNGILWSGNFYPRTGCDPKTGICENATCVGTLAGLSCGPGTGPSPGTNTLAELTFQAFPSVDFYDVSIINGANLATSFGPTNVSISATQPYQCGTAGSTSAQNGGYPAGLPAAPWTMAPSAASFPAPGVPAGNASAYASYYRMVLPVLATGTSPTQCSDNTPCTDGTNTTCGWSLSDIAAGKVKFDTRVCGKPVAWASANAIWGFNQSATNLAPFAFTTHWPNGLTGTNAGPVSVGDLQLCINRTYSSYIANGTAAAPIQPIPLACGGVMWGATQTSAPIGSPPAPNAGLGITTPSTPVFTANLNWLNYVLPTIQWLKQACPTCYTYPFDDMSSTFTCADAARGGSTNYGVTFSDLQ